MIIKKSLLFCQGAVFFLWGFCFKERYSLKPSCIDQYENNIHFHIDIAGPAR
jgi:hypothetical protein